MKNIVLLMFVVFMAACSSTKNYQTSYSYHGAVPEEQKISKAIADDMAAYIATMYAPGHTSFKLITPNDEKAETVDGITEDTFSVIFENALRQKGFEISQKGLELSYTIDSLEEGFYTQIRFGDGNNFSSVYNKNGNSISSRSSLLGGDKDE